MWNIEYVGVCVLVIKSYKTRCHFSNILRFSFRPLGFLLQFKQQLLLHGETCRVIYIKDFCTAIINMTNVTSSDLSAEP